MQSMNKTLLRLFYLVLIGFLCCFFQVGKKSALEPNLPLRQDGLDSVFATLRTRADNLLTASVVDSMALVNISRGFSELGRHADSLSMGGLATKSYGVSLSLLQRVSGKLNTRTIAQATLDFGIALRNNDDLDSSLIILKEALALYESIDKVSVSVGNCYDHLAAAYVAKQDFYKAIQYFQKQYDILVEVNKDDVKWLSYPLCNMAHAYARLGDYSKAANLYEKGLRLGGSMGGQQHHFWNTLSDYYLAAGNFTNALRTQERSLTLKSAIYKGQPNVEVGMTYRKLGAIRSAMRDSRAADSLLAYSERILIQCSGASKVELISTRIAQAELWGRQDRVTEALAACEMAVSDCLEGLGGDVKNDPERAVQASRYPQLLASAQQVKGDLLAAGQPDAQVLERAVRSYDYAIGCIGHLYRSMEEDESKSYLLHQAMPLFEKAIGAAYALWEVNDEQAALAKVFDLMEKSKANLLLESLRESGARDFSGIPRALTDEERILCDRKRLLEADIEFFSQYYPSDSPKVRGLSDALFETDRRYQALKDQISDQYPNYFEMKYTTQVVEIEAVQKQLERQSSVMLSMFWGRQHLYVLHVSPHKQACTKIALDTAFFQKMGLIKEFLRNPAFDEMQKKTWAQASYELYGMILAPFVGEKKPSNLIVVPDGPLGSLPLQCLLTSLPEKDAMGYQSLPYLIKDCEVSYAYSATTLLQNRSKSAKTLPCAGFAPGYGLPATQPGTTTAPVNTRVLFKPLVFNKQEVETTRKIMGGDMFIGSDATESTFKQHAGRYNILHLAMHGLANDSFPNRSLLAFSNTPMQEDNLLFCYEIYGLQLNADLAVLSACETGMGRWQEGEGILSLGRAFHFAGCPSVIAGHWNVDDAVATRLMGDFYSILADGKDYVAALEQAKRNIINNADDERLGHPFYWATYNLMGGTLAPSRDPKWGHVGIGLLLALSLWGAWKWLIRPRLART
jgi:CHAT domain-containing protein